MTQTITCQTLDAAKSVSLLAAPYSITWEGIDKGEAAFTDSGKVKDRNHERTTEYDRQPRSMGWTQQIDEDSLDDLNGAYSDLKDVICQPVWVLVLNAGGATEPNKYYYCYAVTSVPKFTTRMVRSYFHKYDVRFEARPFARGAAIDLPRNWIVDPLLSEDFNADGIANSFVNDDSGGAPTHSNYIDAVNGAQVISMNADGSGVGSIVYCGLKQASLMVGNFTAGSTKLSGRIEYSCSASTPAYYDIYLYCTGAGTPEKYLLQNHSAVQASFTEVKFENYTIPAGTTAIELRVRIVLPDDSIAATVWLAVRKAMLVQAAALPVGKDGGTLYYGSEVAESPATLTVENVPGDVEANALIQIGTTTPGIPGWQKIDATTGGTTAGNYAGLKSDVVPQWCDGIYAYRAVIKYKTSATLTNCKIQIFVEESDTWNTEHYLKDDATVATAETTLTLNWTFALAHYGSSTVRLKARIVGTGGNQAGTLYVKEASIYTYATGWPNYYLLNNQMQSDSNSDGICDGFNDDDSTPPTHTNSMEVVSGSNSYFLLGNDPKIDDVKGSLLYKFSGASDAKCLGGVCSAAFPKAVEHEIAPGVAGAGKYMIMGRMKTSSTTAATDTFYIKQFQYNQIGVSSYVKTPTIMPFTVKDKWTVIFFGMLEIPSNPSTTWKDFKSSLVLSSTGSAGTNHYIDYIHLLPVENYLRANPTEIVAHTIVSDTIDIDNPSLYAVNETSGPVFPFVAGETSSNNCVPLSQKHDDTGMSLAPGVVNKLIPNIIRTAAAADADQVQSIANAIMAIRYTPLFLE